MSTRIDYATVRPGMTVTTYSGQPIEVTAVRHVTRLLGEGRGWTRTVELAGNTGGRHVEHCYQLPERRTEVLAVDFEIGNRRAVASHDAVLTRTNHDYSRRYVELITDIRVGLFDDASSVG